MSKEGGTQAPIRHPLKFRDPDFINPEKIDGLIGPGGKKIKKIILGALEASFFHV